MNLCKSVFTCEIVLKTSRSTYLQAVFSKNHVSKKSCFLKTDLTLTNMIFRTHKCVNTCVAQSFDKITIFVKFTRRCKDGISLKARFLRDRIALYKDPLKVMRFTL